MLSDRRASGMPARLNLPLHLAEWSKVALMDLLHQMRVLISVVETNGFASAGRALQISPAAVTRAIADLESTLGVGLLTRSTRVVKATEAGTRYVEDCKRILAEVQEANDAAGGQNAEPRGRLVVTAPVLYGAMFVIPAVTRYLSAYPETEAQVILLDRVVNLVDEGIDVAFRIGELPDSSMHAQRLGEVRLVACASPDYIARHGAPLHPRELQSHTCIAATGLAPSSEWRFVEDGRSLGVRVRPRLWTSTNDAAIAAATAGFGVARVLDYQVASHLADRRLKLVLDGFLPAPLPVHLVYPQGRKAPIRVRRFIDLGMQLLGDTSAAPRPASPSRAGRRNLSA